VFVLKIAICIEKSGGILFGGKRLSQDSILRNKLKELAGDGKLLMNEYSAKQFESNEKLKVCEDFILSAGQNDICFVENVEIPMDKVSEVYLFNWNRDYPADTYFEFEPKESNFKRIKKEDFVGSSHKKITLEVYRRG